MGIYNGNEINKKLRKMTRMPEIDECFGIFSSQILGTKAYNEELNKFDEFNKGIEYSSSGVVKGKEDYALIFRYLGDNRCQELLTSKIMNLDSFKNLVEKDHENAIEINKTYGLK